MTIETLDDLREALRAYRGDIDRVSEANLLKAAEGYDSWDALTPDELNKVANKALALTGPPPGGWDISRIDLKDLVR